MANTKDWRRDRKPRKRGFDDDSPMEGGWSMPAMPSAPSSAAAPRRFSAPVSGPESSAQVKRFDAERGFGFVSVDGGTGDAFLHVSVLRRVGVEAVAPGTRLRVRVGQGDKGPQVTEVLEVGEVEDLPPQAPRGPRPAFRPGPASYSADDGTEVRGTVKWYNASKGFGFITPADGGKDVFVHATALERSGMSPLAEGQVVTIRVVQGKKGPEAVSVSEA